MDVLTRLWKEVKTMLIAAKILLAMFILALAVTLVVGSALGHHARVSRASRAGAPIYRHRLRNREDPRSRLGR